jgi:hypothetical protein
VQKQNFAVFVDLWNIQQGFKTPLIHHKMAKWLQASWDKGNRRLLLMAFRASGKSTIVGLFSAWLLLQDPDLRILVLAADASLARKMVRDVRKILEKHPLTPHLLPSKIDQWASNRFTIERQKQLRDPSMLGMGVTSNITGSRADIIIYDDVEVPNTCASVEKREALRLRLQESNFILVPDGMQLYVGTPHSYFSIYADSVREEINEKKTFLDKFKRFFLPVLDEKRDSAWPEQFSKEAIDLLAEQSGPNKFASQMMLEPVNVINSRLDVNLLRHYDDDLIYAEANKKTMLSIGGKVLVSCSAWWDPAFGSAQGDKSVLAIVFTDAHGNYHLHQIHYIDIRNKEEGVDEASAQCQIVADILEQNYAPSVTIETNGIGKFLPAILRRELAGKNIACAVVEKSNNKAKEARILEAYDAIMAARCLYVHERVKETPYLREMMEWAPQTRNNKDDGLDAVAGALSQEPVRLKRVYTSASRKWSAQSDAYTASTNFDV